MRKKSPPNCVDCAKITEEILEQLESVKAHLHVLIEENAFLKDENRFLEQSLQMQRAKKECV